MKSNLRRIKYQYIRLKRLKGSPHALALGTAIGVFIGLTPTIPLHTILILLLTILTRSSSIAGVIISWVVCNPLTYIPIYYFSVIIGNKLTPYNLDWYSFQQSLEILLSKDANTANSLSTMVDLGIETISVLLAGGIVLAIPFGVAGYYASLYFFTKLRNKQLKKQILN